MKFKALAALILGSLFVAQGTSWASSHSGGHASSSRSSSRSHSGSSYHAGRAHASTHGTSTHVHSEHSGSRARSSASRTRAAGSRTSAIAPRPRTAHAETQASATTNAPARGQGKGYVNSRGEWVPSPTRTANGKPPKGATARCGDGSYSFSRSHRGTCSHHGGAASWLD